MRLNLKYVFISVFIVSVFLALLVNYGVVFALLVTNVLAWYVAYVYRAILAWPKAESMQRVYASVAVAAFSFLIVFGAKMTAIHTPLGNQRVAKRLQHAVGREIRFENITVEYQERKAKFVYISGAVQTKSDLTALKHLSDGHTFPQIDATIWNIRVAETGEVCEGTSAALFPENDP